MEAVWKRYGSPTGGEEGCNMQPPGRLAAGEAPPTMQASSLQPSQRSSVVPRGLWGLEAWGSCRESEGRREDHRVSGPHPRCWKGTSLPARWVKCRANPVKLRSSIGSEWGDAGVSEPAENRRKRHANTGAERGDNRVHTSILLCHSQALSIACLFLSVSHHHHSKHLRPVDIRRLICSVVVLTLSANLQFWSPLPASICAHCPPHISLGLHLST